MSKVSHQTPLPVNYQQSVAIAGSNSCEALMLAHLADSLLTPCIHMCIF